jgi:hypothetical protein
MVLALILALVLALFAGSAQANDRPFQVARTAVMEDDEQAWAFESWAEQRGRLRGLTVEPEYSFRAGTSLQLQLSRFVDRDAVQTGRETELEFKHIFNHIGRDGWGLGISGALGWERSAGEANVRSVGLKLPLSINLGAGYATLHLSPGLSKSSDSRRSWTRAVAIEREVFKRTTAFAELAQEGTLRLAQIGARHWLRRDKLAFDIAWQQQQRAGEPRSAGLTLGLGWYDL